MTPPDHNNTTNDTITVTSGRAAAPARVSRGLAVLAAQLHRLTQQLPRAGDDVAWAARSAGLALVYARRAGWWGVLVYVGHADPTVPYAYAQAARIARDQARRDARFWRETARDYQARAERRPTSDAAGALSNWHDLGVSS